MRFGICYSYWQRDWALDYAGIKAAVRKIAGLGLDVLEIGTTDIATLSAGQRQRVRQLCESVGVELIAGGGLSKAFDVASADAAVRRSGVGRLQNFLPLIAEAGVRTLGGTLFGYWPYDYSAPFDKTEAWKHSVSSMRDIALVAEQNDVEIVLEVVNRYEHFLLNTAREAVRYVEEVENPSVGILLDSFHMNIEEDDPCEAIDVAGKHLKHLHLGETNRKLPGTGHVNWPKFGQALRDNAYDGAIVLEPFILSECKVAQDIYVWRDLSDGGVDQQLNAALVESVDFLRKTFS